MKIAPGIKHGKQVIMLQDMEEFTIERGFGKLNCRCCNYVSHLRGLAAGMVKASPVHAPTSALWRDTDSSTIDVLCVRAPTKAGSGACLTPPAVPSTVLYAAS